MKTIFIFILLYVIILTACNAGSSYRKISAEEAYQIMQNTDEYILLDVRTISEYNEEHIYSAVLIPDYEIENRAAAELPDKNALILIYCRSGRRSANAAKELIKLGYTKVYDFGGIIDWRYDTVRRSSI
jgi:rhodanese-related sulfurtransferase